MTQQLPPWSIDHISYPVAGPPNTQLEFLVRYAVLAPSTHNSQPWLFRVRNDALELFADRSRSLQICDPHDRELTISCGAALGFALLAARNFGHVGHVELLPPNAHPDLLARLRLDGPRGPSAAETRRFNAIPDRRTTRTAFAPNGIPAETLATLQQLAAEHQTSFVLTRAMTERNAIANLVAEADHIQMSNPAFRAELAHWLHPGNARSADGMSIASFGYGDRLSTVAAAIIRTFDIGAGVAARNRQLATGSPVLGVLSSPDDTPLDWLRTGMALADILLEATADDLQTAFLNQPIEVPDLRPRLAKRIGSSGVPQILLRLGKGHPSPPSARREARHVIGG